VAIFRDTGFFNITLAPLGNICSVALSRIPSQLPLVRFMQENRDMICLLEKELREELRLDRAWHLFVRAHKNVKKHIMVVIARRNKVLFVSTPPSKELHLPIIRICGEKDIINEVQRVFPRKTGIAPRELRVIDKRSDHYSGTESCLVASEGGLSRFEHPEHKTVWLTRKEIAQRQDIPLFLKTKVRQALQALAIKRDLEAGFVE